MFATRWEPFVGMNRLQNGMGRLLDDLGSRSRGYATDVYPPMNLWEDDDNLYMEAELPGLGIDDLEIFVTGGNQLSIKGERKQPELEDGKWHRRERGFGKFSRIFELPVNVNADEVSAEFSQGVLTITLPKAVEAKPRKIEVKAS